MIRRILRSFQHGYSLPTDNTFYTNKTFLERNTMLTRKDFDDTLCNKLPQYDTVYILSGWGIARRIADMFAFQTPKRKNGVTTIDFFHPVTGQQIIVTVRTDIPPHTATFFSDPDYHHKEAEWVTTAPAN